MLWCHESYSCIPHYFNSTCLPLLAGRHNLRSRTRAFDIVPELKAFEADFLLPSDVTPSNATQTLAE